MRDFFRRSSAIVRLRELLLNLLSYLVQMVPDGELLGAPLLTLAAVHAVGELPSPLDQIQKVIPDVAVALHPEALQIVVDGDFPETRQPAFASRRVRISSAAR